VTETLCVNTSCLGLRFGILGTAYLQFSKLVFRSARGFPVTSNLQVAAVMPPSLQDAVASGDVALATTLVDASLTSNGGAHASRNMAVMDRAGDMMGRTALHIASESGHGVMVEWLLTQCQAEANARDSQGARPLHYAAEGNKVDAIDVLLRNGAKVSMAVRALPSSFQIKSFQVGTLD